MVQPAGPIFTGEFEVLISDSGSGEQHRVRFLPDLQNAELQAEGYAPRYYLLPTVSRLPHTVLQHAEQQLLEKFYGHPDHYWGWRGPVQPRFEVAPILAGISVIGGRGCGVWRVSDQGECTRVAPGVDVAGLPDQPMLFRRLILPVWSRPIRLRMSGAWSRIYDHFAGHPNAGYRWSSADIRVEFDNLRARGAIELQMALDDAAQGAYQYSCLIEQYGDLAFEKFLHEVVQRIFVPAPRSLPMPALPGAGILGAALDLSGGFALVDRRSLVGTRLSYDQTHCHRYCYGIVLSVPCDAFAGIRVGRSQHPCCGLQSVRGVAPASRPAWQQPVMIGPIGIDVVLSDPSQLVRVEFKTVGAGQDEGPRVSFAWSQHNYDQPCFWPVEAGPDGGLPRYRYQVSALVEGGPLLPGLMWSGPWLEGSGSGPLMLHVPRADETSVVTRQIVIHEPEPAILETQPDLLHDDQADLETVLVRSTYIL